MCIRDSLRGAMSDYDIALDIDPNNFIGHYNRGLLRAQVGDDNRAIQDFNSVSYTHLTCSFSFTVATDITKDRRSDGAASFNIDSPIFVNVEFQAYTGRCTDTCSYFIFTLSLIHI